MADPIPFVRPFTPPVADTTRKLEQALLGAILMNAAKAIPRLPPTFQAEHYAFEIHRSVHECVMELGPSAAIPTVIAALQLQPEDRAYVAGLLEVAEHWQSTESMAQQVTDAHQRREIVGIVDQMRRDVERGANDVTSAGIIALAMARLDALATCMPAHRGGSTFDAALDGAIAHAERAMRGEEQPGRSTGMPSVDEALGGLENATFNVLAARPGMGKTALAVQWALHIARQCKAEKSGGVLGFSLEMSAVALGRRVLSEASRISVTDLRRGRIGGREGTLTRVRHEMAGLPVLIEDAGGQNIVAIRQKARAAQRTFGRLALIWVDHINIVRPDDADRKQGATQATGRISNALRDLSKEFDCPVLCLSQLNRGLLQRDDKRPNLGDLRQAGDVEQDADTVMFLHREEVFLPKSEPEQASGETLGKYQERVRQWDEQKIRTAGKAELILEKVRDGAPTTVALRFDGATTSFSEPASTARFDNVPPLSHWQDGLGEFPPL